MWRQAVIGLARLFFSYWPIERGKWRLWRLFKKRIGSRKLEPVIRKLPNGMLIRLDPQDFVDRFIYFWNMWEPNETKLVGRLLNRGGTFVDVGANIGYFSLLASKIVGSTGSVIAVEATPSTAERLRFNMELNKLGNVTIHDCAVAREEGTVRINARNDENSGMNSLRASPTGKGWDVPCRRLDDLLAGKRIDLIKMDIEGAELLALQGMPRIIASPEAPDLILEICPPYLSALGSDHREIFRLLKEAGYSARRVGERKLEEIGPGEALKDDFEATVYFSKRL
jgi:FkbM family methyltransferase